MSSFAKYLDTLLGSETSFPKQELEALIKDTESDSEAFIREMGQYAQSFIEQRATGEITNDEFKEFMSDLVSLGNIQDHKLSLQAKQRAETVALKLTDLVLEKLLPMLVEAAL